MSTFDERKKAFEKKFAHDSEIQFKVEARRNKLLGLWASGLLGKSELEQNDYVKEVIKADMEEAGDMDVFRKVRKDFDEKNVSVSDEELRQYMDQFLLQAKEEIIGKDNI